MKTTATIAFLWLTMTFTSFSATAQTYLNPTANVEDRVEDALGRMTLEEKIAVIHAQSKFTTPGVPRLGIRQLNMDDGPHGVREELEWNTWRPAGWTNDRVVAFPSLTCLAATWNRDLSALYGNAVSEEFAFRGKDVMLGPGCNIARTPYNGRAFEYMGEDPLLAGEQLVPYIKAAQQNGVACCLKHFVLNDMETERFWNDVHVSERALHEIYLAPFRKAVEDAHVWSIMGSYNFWKGQHCCHNDTLLNKILKGEWQWDGALISDWGGVHDTWQAIHNGLDIEMGTYTDGKLKEAEFTYDDYYMAQPFLKLIREGKVSEKLLDEKVRRVLRIIFRTAMNPKKVIGSQCSEAHYDACRQIAEEGIVLLKNRSLTPSPKGEGRNSILPLTKEKLQHLFASSTQGGRILVVGENATRSLTQGGGSSELKTLRDISPLEGLQNLITHLSLGKGAGVKLDYAQGYASGRAMYDHVDKVSPDVQARLKAEALEKAKQADLIIYFGGMNKNHRQDCENGDRESYDLSFGQNELISQLADIQPNIIVVTFGGNAFAMPWIDKVAAMLHCWYLGSESGTAIANILTGKVCPSGRLPITIARRVDDYSFFQFGERAYPGVVIPEAERRPSDGVSKNRDMVIRRNIYYDEDLFVGYRHFDSHKVKALFPFGFGLSYTTFEYGKAVATPLSSGEGEGVRLSIPVTNTGSVAGKETVQLYVGQAKAPKDRPLKELKDYRKISLQPGETQTVTFTVTPDMLRQYSENEHQWTFIPGRYTCYIGSSVADIKQKANIQIQ